ncbi:MAG: pilus assembly protein PilM [Phycisphaerales bacterium]|nr:pilus assembly protein PilM [Phycisphaerales bacterium]
MIDLLKTSRTLPIGIDLGSTGARLLQLAQGRKGLRVAASARVDLTSRAAPDDPARVQELIEAIANTVRAGTFTGTNCIIGLDDRMVRTRSFRQPPMPESELAKAASLDGAEKLGFPEGQPAEISTFIAGEVRQGDEVRHEVVYVGAPRAPIETMVRGLMERGLRPLHVEPGFCAEARAFARTFQRAEDRLSVRVVVDLGWASSSVLLLRGTDIAFYKRLDLGGDQLTKHAAERLGLDIHAVADLRQRRMQASEPGHTPVDAKVDRAIYQVTRPLLNDLAHEVKLCMRYYAVTFRGIRPECCHIVGGEAREPGLVEAFEQALHIPAKLGDPLQGVSVQDAASTGRTRIVAGAPAPDWAVACGLSLRLSQRKSRRARRDATRTADVPPHGMVDERKVAA